MIGCNHESFGIECYPALGRVEYCGCYWNSRISQSLVNLSLLIHINGYDFFCSDSCWVSSWLYYR